MSPGIYNLDIMYTSTVEATFKVAFGEYNAISNGSAPSIVIQLPAMVSGMMVALLVAHSMHA
jgi:hypothetical protein